MLSTLLPYHCSFSLPRSLLQQSCNTLKGLQCRTMIFTNVLRLVVQQLCCGLHSAADDVWLQIQVYRCVGHVPSTVPGDIATNIFHNSMTEFCQHLGCYCNVDEQVYCPDQAQDPWGSLGTPYIPACRQCSCRQPRSHQWIKAAEMFDPSKVQASTSNVALWGSAVGHAGASTP